MKKEPEVVVIQPSVGLRFPNFYEISKWYESLLFLAYKNISVRYKQSVLGVGWAILNPLITLGVFIFVFGKVAKISSGDIPYPVFIISGIVLWGFYSKCLTSISSVVIANTQLIEKIYFPRIILPLSVVLSSLFDLLIAIPLLLLVLYFHDIAFTLKILFVPIFVLHALISCLGLGLWFAAANVFYRDVSHIVPFFTQMFMFLTPIVYPFSNIPESFTSIYILNPMLTAVEGFRWCLIPNYEMPSVMFIIGNSIVALILLVSGLVFFRTSENTFADRI